MSQSFFDFAHLSKGLSISRRDSAIFHQYLWMLSRCQYFHMFFPVPVFEYCLSVFFLFFEDCSNVEIWILYLCEFWYTVSFCIHSVKTDPTYVNCLDVLMQQHTICFGKTQYANPLTLRNLDQCFRFPRNLSSWFLACSHDKSFLLKGMRPNIDRCLHI